MTLSFNLPPTLEGGWFVNFQWCVCILGVGDVGDRELVLFNVHDIWLCIPTFYIEYALAESFCFPKFLFDKCA